MKKISLALLAAAASITVAQAAPFNGFYAGANLGLTQRSVKTDVSGQVDIAGVKRNIIDHHKTKRNNGFLYGLMAGYGQNMNGFYLGGEVSLHHDTASKWENHGVEVTTATGKTTRNVRLKWERSPVLGLTPRLGAIIGNDMLVYAKLGLEFSRNQSKAQAEGVNDMDKSSRKTFVTFVPGLGVEKAFGNVLARIEYGYDLGAKRSWSENTGAFTSTTSQKYTAHTVKLGVAWQF